MKKALRRRFILFAMSTVTILLAVLIGATSGFSWILLNRQADAVLHALASADNPSFSVEPHEPRPFAPPMNMDMLRSARFFTVLTDPNGIVLDVNIDQISSVGEEQAAEYAGQAAGISGKIDGYKYEVKKMGENRLIYFMDTASQVNTFVMIFGVSATIALICWLLILLFVLLYSGRAVRPILAGIEKQKQFITNAGHELKTPLAIIQSNNDASTLIYGETKYSKNIRQQTQRLDVLMTNLLTLSKLDEETKLPTERVDISELICGMLPAYEAVTAERRITLSLHIQPHVFMQVHRDTFSQMLSILLDNAAKYTTEGGTIRFSVTGDGRHIEIMEENTCAAAVSSPDPERLFERFYRGDSARTQGAAVSGYGIGLSAARTIAETFGGRLTAEYPEAGLIRFTARF